MGQGLQQIQLITHRVVGTGGGAEQGEAGGCPRQPFRQLRPEALGGLGVIGQGAERFQLLLEGSGSHWVVVLEPASQHLQQFCQQCWFKAHQ